MDLTIHSSSIASSLQCRACPSEGVSCDLGVLTILPDWWFDTKQALVPDGEGKLGIGPNTQLYKCSARDACLTNTSAIPMTMYCDENHTGVLCEHCFHRRIDCGRVAGSDEKCVAPGYLQRDEEWMFFAKIARKCERCAAGAAALYNWFITFAASFGVIFVTVALIAMQLHDVKRMLLNMDGVRDGSRANATGPIARLILNWFQATGLLSTIKLVRS